MKNLQYLIANISGSVETRMLKGEEFFVAPVVLMTEGVHAGNMGPQLYRKQDLQRSVPAWNHKPIVISHPKNENGEFVSAGSPEVLEASGVGMLLNAKWDNKLRAQAWIGKSRINTVDERLESAINENKITEVSTGLFTDVELVTNAKWNGIPYVGIAVNHQPDHLAVLFDEIGACSVAAGAGLFQVNSNPEQTRINAMYQSLMAGFNALLINELGHNETRSMIQEHLRAAGYDGWLEEIYDSYFVFNDLQGGFHRLMYVIDEKAAKVTFVGDPEEVRRVVSYQELKVNSTDPAIDDSTPKSKGEEMDKTARQSAVTELIRNSQWTEAQRAVLVDMEDTAFEMVRINSVPTVNQTTPAPEVKTPATLEEAVASLPEQFRGVVANSLLQSAAQRTALISKIIANTSNKLTEAQLQAMQTEVLENIHSSLAVVVETPAAPVVNFAGAGPVVTNAAGKPVEPLALPTMSFDKK